MLHESKTREDKLVDKDAPEIVIAKIRHEREKHYYCRLRAAPEEAVRI